MHKPVIGSRRFTDGITRSVHQAKDGRQFVVDDDGAEVFGQWLPPEDESDAPLIVERGQREAQA
jgi:hypothetical protein